MSYIYVTTTLPDTFYPSSNEGWNAGAVGVDLLDSDATYRFHVGGVPAGIVTGISNPAADVGYSYTEIEYAFYVGGGTYRILELGIQKTLPVASSIGQAYSIIRIGNTIQYAVDGTVVYTSTVPATASLMVVDASLYLAGDSIVDAEISEVYRIVQDVSTASALSPVSSVSKKLSSTVGGSSVLAAGVRIGSSVYLGTNVHTASTVSTEIHKTSNLSAGVYSSSVFSVGELLTRNDGSTAALEPLVTFATDYPLATSSSTLQALTGSSSQGFISPEVSYSASSLSSLSTNGAMLTGENAAAINVQLSPLSSLSADYLYGESTASFFGLLSLSGTYIEFDAMFSALTPAVSMYAVGHAGTQPNGSEITFPSITLKGESGGTFKGSSGTVNLNASGTVPVVGRVTASIPYTSIAANTLSGAVGKLNATATLSTSVTSYAGGYVTLRVPKVSIGTDSTIGGIAKVVISSPLISIESEVFPSDYGRATLDVPTITSLYGITDLRAPLFSLTSSIFNAPSGYTGYAMNVANNAISRYPNYHFEHILRFNGTYYGVLNNVLFSLAGEYDNGLDIASTIEVSPSSLNISNIKRMPYVYVGGRANQTIAVQPVGDQKVVGTYTSEAVDRTGTHARRVTLPRGARAKYWGLVISNVKGDALDVDFIEYKIETTSRKT